MAAPTPQTTEATPDLRVKAGAFETALSPESKRKYFSDRPNEVKASLIDPEDLDMRMAISRYVADVYDQHHFLDQQPDLVIPDSIDPRRIYDKKETKALVLELAMKQYENGKELFENGTVFKAVKKDGRRIGIIDCHEELQRTYVVTLGAGEILYSLRAIQRNGVELPIQKLTHTLNEKGEPIIQPDSDEHRKIIEAAQVEISQLAVGTNRGEDTNLILYVDAMRKAFNYLFSILFKTEKALGNNIMVATLDNKRYEDLNNVKGTPRHPCYGLIPLGPVGYYMGSDCMPLEVIPEHIVESTRRTHPELADILAGNFEGPILVPPRRVLGLVQ